MYSGSTFNAKHAMIDNLEEKKTFFHTLNERQRRHFAATEANALGRHGVLWVSEAFDIHPHTIREGKKELAQNQTLPPGRIRRPGGGRKKKTLPTS